MSVEPKSEDKDILAASLQRMGLIAAGQAQHPAVARGIRYLLLTQQPDGTWNEAQFTGTGFPQVFYLRYHYYRIYFPLLALANWSEQLGVRSDELNAAREELALARSRASEPRMLL